MYSYKSIFFSQCSLLIFIDEYKQFKIFVSSISVSDLLKPCWTWSSLFFIWFDPGPVPAVSVCRLFALCLLCQVLFRHIRQVDSFGFRDTELLWLGQGDPVALQLILTVDVPSKSSSALWVFECLHLWIAASSFFVFRIHWSQTWRGDQKGENVDEIDLSVPLGRLCHSHAVVDQQLGKSC